MTLSGSYALSSRLRVAALVPYRRIVSPKKDLTSGDRYFRHFSGVGDLIVAGTYLPFTSMGRGMNLALTAGARLPTGDANPDHDWGYGISRDPVLQTGYGTVDPVWGVSGGAWHGRLSTTATVAGRVSGGENVYGYRYSNEVQSQLGLRYRFSDRVSAGLSSAYLKSWHDVDQQVMVGNTGGEWLYGIPEVTFSAAGVQLDVSMQFPLYYFINGGQLMSQSILTTGLRFDVTQPAMNFFSVNRAELSPLAQSGTALTKLLPADLSNLGGSGEWRLIEFMSRQCHACREFEPKLRNFASRHGSLFVAQIDIFDYSAESLKPYAIESTPTMILFGPDGQPVARVEGTDLAKIEAALATNP
ncbi:transporter [candidate division KSB1 bacterium]|nr:transporter [candidate division KSB1 bacterium]